jgi:protein tyrosine/serine phosphatase
VSDGPPPAAPATGSRSPHQWRLWLAGLIGSRYDGLRHFAVVDPGVLMRCGQPHVRDLERIHAEHGLGCVFVARGGTRHPLRGRWFRAERRFCQQRRIRLEHVPFSDHAPPPPDIFDRFLAVVADPACRPVLVHCEQGFHRTGVLCAAYRLAVCGWSLEAALHEMRRYGFEWEKPKRRPLYQALLAWAQARRNAAGAIDR